MKAYQSLLHGQVIWLPKFSCYPRLMRACPTFETGLEIVRDQMSLDTASDIEAQLEAGCYCICIAVPKSIL